MAHSHDDADSSQDSKEKLLYHTSLHCSDGRHYELLSSSLHESNEFVQAVLKIRNQMQSSGHMPLQLHQINRIFRVDAAKQKAHLHKVSMSWVVRLRLGGHFVSLPLALYIFCHL